MLNPITRNNSSVPATDVILHAFDWPYKTVAARAEHISQLGYKTVLVSPPMKSLKHKSGTAWWQRYQPQDYRIIDNELGNTLDFRSMMTCLKEHGIRVYVDVVFNHMANEAYLRSDLQYPSQQELQAYADDPEYYESLRLFGDLSCPLFTENDFVEAFGIKDWRDKWQVQNGRITGGPHDAGLPTLRDCEHVIEQQRAYLLAMKEMGVKGFRIDAAKHISIEQLRKVWTKEITEGVHIFGEIITDGGATKQEYELFLKPYLNKTRLGAYDFPLFNTVHQALQGQGRMSALIDPYNVGEALKRQRAITFVITHDIPNNDVFQGLIMAEEYEWLGYCYILCRDGGVPLVYTDLDTSGINDSSGHPRWMNAWQDPKMKTLIDFHNHVHSLPMAVLEVSDEHIVFSRAENGLVAINKSDVAINVRIRWQKAMFDLVEQQALYPDDGRLEFTVPAKGYRCLVGDGVE
ncbi:alpha-amylase family protein [Vibrio sp. B1Z05]|uniref:alpha-amylase family protein n=1 Tax=Vibrio sp. B1Z05 TaxID=2654980 RepID=UPI00128CD219|nr:alpha-amylase family protein [Vibrio sp. B1Z05]MPW36288.1 alpha-amylase [Vibrio sp. B1Z05]